MSNRLNKIYAYLGPMSAGKTSEIINNDFDYRKQGLKTLILKPDYDTRETTEPMIVSKVNSKAPCTLLKTTLSDFDGDIDKLIDSNEEVLRDVLTKDLDAIFIDEVQFIQLPLLLKIFEWAKIHSPKAVFMIYGLRNSYNWEPFESSVWLLQFADKLTILRSICHCGKAATCNMMIGPDGFAIKDKGLNPIDLGGDEKYVSVCRTHYEEGKWINVKDTSSFWGKGEINLI